MRNQSDKIGGFDGNSMNKYIKTEKEPEGTGSRNLEMLNMLVRNSSIDQQYYTGNNEPPAMYQRTQSHGNLFTGMIMQQPSRVHTLRQGVPQTYAMECLQYEKYLFDNRIRLIIKRMSIKAYNLLRNQKQFQFFTFPIQKLLIIISKKLLLNRFELLFLEYVFEETKWKYNIQCIRKHSYHFNSFVLLSDSDSLNTQIKYIQLYILYCAYYSKKSLNQLPSDNIFGQFLTDTCPKFKEEFPQWTQNSTMPSRINPKHLNSIFKKLTYNYDKDHEDSENYSLIVEEILDISPAYNADKGGKDKKKPKKKKKETHPQVKPEYNPPEREQSNRLMDIVQQQSEQMEILAFKNKKQSSFISNVDPLQPRHYILRSMSNQQ